MLRLPCSRAIVPCSLHKILSTAANAMQILIKVESSCRFIGRREPLRAGYLDIMIENVSGPLMNG